MSYSIWYRQVSEDLNLDNHTDGKRSSMALHQMPKTMRRLKRWRRDFQGERDILGWHTARQRSKDKTTKSQTRAFFTWRYVAKLRLSCRISRVFLYMSASCCFRTSFLLYSSISLKIVLLDWFIVFANELDWPLCFYPFPTLLQPTKPIAPAV